MHSRSNWKHGQMALSPDASDRGGRRRDESLKTRAILNGDTAGIRGGKPRKGKQRARRRQFSFERERSQPPIKGRAEGL